MKIEKTPSLDKNVENQSGSRLTARRLKRKSHTQCIRERQAPVIILEEKEKLEDTFWEFFDQLSNENTRHAYLLAVYRFLDWCHRQELSLDNIGPANVTAYFHHHPGSAMTINQHLAAVRKFMEWLVMHGLRHANPTLTVRAPVKRDPRGKTPLLTPAQARNLLDSIDTSHLIGLRDRALIGVLIYAFCRISTALQLCVRDYFEHGGVQYLRLYDKRQKPNLVPVHHNARTYLDEYLKAGELLDDLSGPIFRSSNRSRERNQLLDQVLTRKAALKMLKRRLADAGFPSSICCHSFRGTGITEFLRRGGDLETAAHIAGHESMQSTLRYSRKPRIIAPEEIERINI